MAGEPDGDGQISAWLREIACEETIRMLDERSRGISPDGVAWGAHSWLEAHRAGAPLYPLLMESVREDARYWAETAHPAELECYAVATIDRLREGLFASRQIKRLIGGLWRRMSPDEKREFLEWALKHERGE